jgi:hypothetical protein
MDPQTYLPILIDYLLPVVASLLGTLLLFVANTIRKKVANDYARGVLLRAVDAVALAVSEVEQVVVPEIKASAKDGKLTRAEAETIRTKAVERAKSYLGEHGLQELKRVVGDEPPEKVLEGLVEAAVQRLKAR